MDLRSDSKILDYIKYAQVSLSEEGQDKFTVIWQQQAIGSIETYENEFHKRNCYVKLDLERYDMENATEIFDILQEREKRPLQIMVDSTEYEKIAFLEKAGFQCKRKSYELDVTANELRKLDTIMEKCTQDYCECKKGNTEYDLCARFMYEYYRKKHEDINPLTAEYEMFLAKLPEEAFCKMYNGEVVHVAFVEENELAYVGTKDKAEFKQFILGIVLKLFEKYEEICFECDDCDEAAMTLKDLFVQNVDESYDTYIIAWDK